MPSPSTGSKQLRHDRTFLLGELVGEKIKVVSSGCRSLQGIEGTIVDETLGTFVIATSARGRKRISKKGSVFEFAAGGRVQRVPGEFLYCRPEERTKKLFQALQKRGRRERRKL
jgi:RNase P/RNase MRP subunit p29